MYGNLNNDLMKNRLLVISKFSINEWDERDYKKEMQKSRASIASEIINSSKLLNDIRRGNTIETRLTRTVMKGI